MRTALLAGCAAVALSIAAPASAQTQNSECLNKLDEVRQNLQKNDQFTKWYRSNPNGRGDYVELIQAARVFANAKMEARCMEVVSGMRELAEKAGNQTAEADRQNTDMTKDKAENDGKTDAADKDRAAQADKTAPKSTDQAARDAKRAPSDAERAQNTRERERMQALKAAKPLTQASVSAEALNGADVRNLKNEDIGDVEDVLMENGRITAVIIARGGFLGLGEANYRFEAQQVKITQKPADNDDVVIVLDVAADKIESMQRVELRNGRWVAAKADETRETERDRKPNASDMKAKDGEMKKAPAQNQQPKQQ